MNEALIPAATIVLLRDEPAYEVLMVERHADIAFAGGALVFPGGRIDTGDCDAAWAEHCDGLEDVPAEQRSARIAAIREAFEETGLLLARRGGEMLGADDAGRLARWRKRVEKDDSLFLEMAHTEGLSLAVDALHLFARWRPPAGVAHRRYDTWFFAAYAPEGQIAHADGGEATEVVWTAPAAALAARDAGLRKMIYPTSRNVELLGVSRSAAEAIASAASRIIRPVEPHIVERPDGRFLAIPDDLGYPVTEEPLVSAMRS